MAYDYTLPEQIIMAIITGFSNFSFIPVILFFVICQRHFELYVSLFTMTTSFMYHFTESLDIEIYMEPGKWHILDNIGSICCFNSLIINFMNIKNEEKRFKLNVVSMLLVIVLQTENPWNLLNTIAPIIFFVLVLFYDYYLHGLPEFKYKELGRAISVLIVAIAMFVKGLDEHSDYLRISHSFWHIFMGIAAFYLWQIREKVNIDFNNIFKEFHKYIHASDDRKFKV
jgi:hypothetical protein